MVKSNNSEIKMALQDMKAQYPNAGYYERMLLVAGYTETSINEMCKEYQGKYVSREDVCEGEVESWEFNQG